MYRSRTTSLAMVSLFLWLTACHSYSQIQIGELPDHGTVRITLASGLRDIVYDPWVDSASIKGQVYLQHPGRKKVDYARPLSDVVKVEAQATDVAATVGLTFGMLVVAAAAVGYAALQSWDCCM